jgi:hypothetical protein
MGKYVYVYSGGGMAETPEAQEQVMAAWGAWFGELGSAVLDIGNAFGAATVVGDGSATATGYSIVSADSLDDAATLAKGCPILNNGGSVAVHEALEM